MAKDQTRRLKQAVLAADRDAFNALVTIGSYSPANPAYAVTALQTAFNDLQSRQATETQTFAAYQAARDGANDAEWAFHNMMLAVKEQVIAQFGKDSDEVQALGLKKKSEYKRPVRRTTEDA